MCIFYKLWRISAVLCVLLFCVPVAELLADTIYLKNGQTLTGDIVQQTRTEIRIQTTAGLKRVQKTTIRRVVFSAREDEAARKAREEAARKSQEEAARKAREEAARKSREEAARKAREEAARKSREEAARKAREEAARKSQAEAARKSEAEQAERDRQEDASSPITRGGALWRSLILPGWGQYYQGRPSAAFGYGGAFLATGAATAVTGSEYQSRQNALDSAGANLNFSVVVLGGALPLIDPDFALRPQLFGLQFLNLAERNAAGGAARSANRGFQLSALLLGTVYIANVVDVIVFHPGENTSVSLYSSPHSGAGLRFQLRF